VVTSTSTSRFPWSLSLARPPLRSYAPCAPPLPAAPGFKVPIQSSYAKLCDALDTPILAAECSDGAHWNAAEFIRRGACDIMRTDTLYKDGSTGGLKVAHLAESFGMKAGMHGEGIANLHLGLAIPNNTYYEDIIINPGNVRSKRNDCTVRSCNCAVSIPEGMVGIGYNLDVKDIEKRALQIVQVSDQDVIPAFGGRVQGP
jgi:hypothetical protein